MSDNMDRDDLIEFHKEVSTECREIMKRKNADYAGDESTPFSNFTACEDLGICETEQGMLVRVLDKMKRIVSFVEKGVLEVKDEPVEDAFKDIINYMILMNAYIEDQRD